MRAFHLAHQLEGRRRQERVSDFMVGEQLERFFRIEFPAAENQHGNAEGERWKQDIQQAASPGPIGRCPEFVSGLREEFVHELHAGEMAEQCTAGM